MLLVWCHWRKLNSGQIPPRNHRITEFLPWEGGALSWRGRSVPHSVLSTTKWSRPVFYKWGDWGLGRDAGCSVTEQPSICGRIKTPPFPTPKPFPPPWWLSHRYTPLHTIPPQSSASWPKFPATIKDNILPGFPCTPACDPRPHINITCWPWSKTGRALNGLLVPPTPCSDAKVQEPYNPPITARCCTTLFCSVPWCVTGKRRISTHSRLPLLLALALEPSPQQTTQLRLGAPSPATIRSPCNEWISCW